MQETSRITRKSASNLALAFIILPPDQRQAMSALYAFCREVDDIADEDSNPVARRREQLALWRQDIRRACSGGTPELIVNRELQPAIVRYQLPLDLFESLLDGVEMDLETLRYHSWEELEVYCYRVASVVGLLSIRIFGQDTPPGREYALALGKALQLTNILRDVWNDAHRGRIYLPQTELAQSGVTDAEILSGKWSARYEQLAGRVAARASAYYDKARSVLPQESRKAMVASELMGAVYWRLLKKLKAARFDVFAREPVRLSKAHKAGLVLRAWAGHKILGRSPCYGSVTQ